ncbi:MAG: sigma-54-dependent Fis family transcriptional regulator [Candidatus Competibacteraceae bacterium]|nr:sigma-54-dependent Fis family transcriptional regulator [Candidatus Competibacteraceae bacterium]MCP5124493.1 sigma-54-dependent Fis family transcriptional regulator [Gammaproteobacteria bacterium]
MRKLLILSTGTVEETLLQKIAAADWEIYWADEVTPARALLTEHQFEVGLGILFSCESERSIQWLTDLILARRKMQWVLALSRQCIDRKQLSSIVTERCYDYHTLPVDAQRLVVTLGHAYGMATLGESTLRQQHELESQYGMIGNSAVMQTLFRGIQKAAEVDVPVLITGESGTGKEQTARSIHDYSARAVSPFAVMNCAALAPNLIQSELFGHEKGAFPGANERHVGLMESANGGTVFLDEIGDLAPELQANLLRFLEEKKIRRVGGTKPIPSDVRLITATNTNLEQSVQEGRFREDLYYRLNVLHLRTPALRERKADVELLSRHFFTKFSAETRTSAKGFSRDALEVINRYDWPGNVRDLMNRIRRAVLLSEGPYIVPTDLELERRTDIREFVTLDEARMAADRDVIQATLLRTRFNIARAAQELGVSRMTLYRLMEKYDIRRDSM